MLAAGSIGALHGGKIPAALASGATLLPSLAICDPELTMGLPPVLTAGTGMDAFTHCVESYLSTTDHPICDGIALEGLRYVARGLEGNRAAARAIVEHLKSHRSTWPGTRISILVTPGSTDMGGTRLLARGTL